MEDIDQACHVHVGVDVGGTNTDAVVLRGKDVVGWFKHVTTADVTEGVCTAIHGALTAAKERLKPDSGLLVLRVHIGTTHFVNAVVQRRGLTRVCVLRLCGPTTASVPSFADFPADLKEVICDEAYRLRGGLEYDGVAEIRPVDRQEILDTIKTLKERSVKNVAVCGVFSPVNGTQERYVRDLFAEYYPEASLSLSCEVGQVGLLERENATILNESLKPLGQATVAALREALDTLGLTCPFFLTQNDGTLLSAKQAMQLPVVTFASGPTNSMRGAAFISGVKDAVVVDIGGTSTDCGVLVNGFPREAAFKVKVGGVRTNFRMPDVISVGLGGGSLVNTGGTTVKVGPRSVGYRLQAEALVFGGTVLTASDVAVAAGLTEMGQPDLLTGHALPRDTVKRAVQEMRRMAEDVIDQVKTSSEAVPVILVGGGSVLIDTRQPLRGATGLLKPAFHQVANAVGAALSQVAAQVDSTVNVEDISREQAIQEAKVKAIEGAVEAGASPDTVQVVDVFEVPLAYIPGQVTRVKVKAVGDLDLTKITGGAIWNQTKRFTVTGGCATKKAEVEGNDLRPTTDAGDQTVNTDTGQPTAAAPDIDPSTGEWTLTPRDLECVMVGAGILGSGGGGTPYYGKLWAAQKLKEGKRIRVITPERLASKVAATDWVAPMMFMGAPTVFFERLCSGMEPIYTLLATQHLYNVGGYKAGRLEREEGVGVQEEPGIRYVTDYQYNNPLHGATEPGTSPAPPGGLAPDLVFEDRECGRREVVGVFSAEIGGFNGFCGLAVAAELDVPVVDCDTMGRAFPELQHMTPMMFAHRPYPACQSDYDGVTDVILQVDTPKQYEDHFRKICVKMGCSSAFNFRLMDRGELMEKTIHHSISRAWRLGNAVLEARGGKRSPVQTILDHEAGVLLCLGKILDVSRSTSGGFARGRLELEGINEFSGQTLNVKFQNENLVATVTYADGAKTVLACTPDIISLVEIDNGEPVATEEVRYGLRVAVVAMTAPPLLRTPEALAVIGPQAFGYPADEVTYIPVGQSVMHKPIGPV